MLSVKQWIDKLQPICDKNGYHVFFTDEARSGLKSATISDQDSEKPKYIRIYPKKSKTDIVINNVVVDKVKTKMELGKENRHRGNGFYYYDVSDSFIMEIVNIFIGDNNNHINDEWLVSGNPNLFDVAGAFRELGKTDWNQSKNYKVGDIVYVYISGDVKAIQFKCKVNKINLTVPEIDDTKFDKSGKFQGSEGRYMELEMIEEFKGDLYKRDVLAQHGFGLLLGPIRVVPELKEYLDFVQKLQHTEEMHPNKHDATYELVRIIINEYAKKTDLYDCDYRDLNLIYLACVGTWKHGIQAKIKTIEESHLSDNSKENIKKQFYRLIEYAKQNKYTNSEGEFNYIGMFGTGFFTFLGKTDDDSPKEFIKMCIDIKDKTDDEETYDICEKILNSRFHGMKAASASVVLHCLAPFTFPVFNSNMGSENIFEYLGVNLEKKNELSTYIKNCRAVKKMRDSNFNFKNYRILDLAAREIINTNRHTNIDYLGVLEYLNNNGGLPYSNPESKDLNLSEKERLLKLKEDSQYAINEIKKMANICKEKFGLDKLEPMSWLDGSNTKISKYLWAQMKDSKYDSPISISIFVEISSETNNARYRVSLEIKNKDTDKKEIDKYHSFLDLPLQTESSLVYVKGGNSIGGVEIIDEPVEIIKEKIANGIYDKVQISRIEEMNDDSTNETFEESLIKGVEELIPYYKYINDDEYYPSLDIYDPEISKEQWIEILNDQKVTSVENLSMFKKMLILGGKSTCANLAKKYGGSSTGYSSLGKSFGQRVHLKTGCELFEEDNKNTYYTIPFLGKYILESGNKRYCWKLREELKEALETMDLTQININNPTENKFDKNMILYGPPGTGKTYDTAKYAVAICEGKTINDYQEYNTVMEKYRELKDEGRIAFTTFHQSYGYEEFIEGIKPFVESENNDVSYSIEPGVFKKFCEVAKIPENIEIDHNSTVWFVRLDKVKENDLKTSCFSDNTIRFDWPKDDDSAYIRWLTQMKAGDYVVSHYSGCCYIDGIGVIEDDEPYYDEDVLSYKWTRKVKWLVKNIHEDITNLNGNKDLPTFELAKLNRVKISDLLAVVSKNGGYAGDKNVKPYIFIIDEINRGNISKIFGELITLIEDTKREGNEEGASAILPYSGEYFSVPDNVYIIGTMNTADRSIALMDTALRRRFNFIEMMPDSNVLRNNIEYVIDGLDVAAMLDTINERIEYLYDREHTIGHAFFMSLKDDPTIESLSKIFENKVIPLLQEYFYEDYNKIQIVLGDSGKSNDDLKFIIDDNIKPNDIFKGNVEDIIDLPEKSYSINKKAFKNINSYKEIM